MLVACRLAGLSALDLATMRPVRALHNIEMRNPEFPRLRRAEAAVSAHGAKSADLPD